MHLAPLADRATALQQGALQHGAFYRFVVLPDPDATALWLRRIVGPLLGSIVVAPEGINGVVAGPIAALDAFQQALHCEPRFASISLRRSTCRTPPFARMKVHSRPEIVSVGLSVGVQANVPPSSRRAGTSVDPAGWRALLSDPNVVVLDNRNAFEFRLGHFRHALNPDVTHFRDFPRYVQQQAPAWREAGKTVAMYCTGGIRCEKTSAWMQGLGPKVRELEGGILNYFDQMPDAEREWQGECFVFDNRIALDTRLQETPTTAEDVYAGDADAAWRLQRARRLATAA